MMVADDEFNTIVKGITDKVNRFYSAIQGYNKLNTFRNCMVNSCL
jgi:hypothetical protein